MKKNGTVRWIFRVFKKFIPKTVIISVLSAAVSLCGIGLILCTKNILNAAQQKILDTKSIILLSAVLVLQIAGGMLCSYLKNRVSAKMDMNLKKRIFALLIKKDYAKISSIHSGEIVNRFSSDIDIVVRGFSGLIPTTVSILTKLLAGMAVFIALEPIIALIVLAVGFGIPLLGRLLARPYKALHKETQRTNGVIRAFLQESIQNMVVVKTFKADSPVKERLDDCLKDNYKIKLKRGLLGVLMHTTLHGSFTVAYYGVIIWGAVGIMSFGLEIGTFMAFLQLVSQLRNPLQNISGILPQYYSTIASAERLIEIEEIDEETVSGLPAAKYEDVYSIEGNGISFSYDNQEVLTSSDFSINKDSVCAIVGESGTGKSTLFRLLLGLYKPESGSLVFKTEHGDIPLDASQRELFSYVPQDAMTLSGTVRENITLLSGDVSEERIKRAAEQAVILDFINSLPQGFDTPIGERGLGLSQGQLQRIAIARALVTESPILLLDECTSALDAETECALLENIKHKTNKTVILITHRPAALDICDSVLYVKDGKITTEIKK